MQNNGTDLLSYPTQDIADHVYAPGGCSGRRPEEAAATALEGLRAFPRSLRLVAAATAAMVLFGLVSVLRIHGLGVIDYPLILAVNALADRSRFFDLVQKAICEYDLFEGVPVVALAAGAFAVASARGRARIVIGGVGAAGAAGASRLIQLFLPSLPRPLYDSALPFRLPYGSVCDALRDWSSYPSDHAALLWGVALATLLVNRRAGAVAIAASTVSSLARIYFGLHYATDILGGALLGAAGVYALLAATDSWEDRLVAFARARAGLVGVVVFLFATQAALLFDDVRAIATSAAHQVKAMEHGAAPAPASQAIPSRLQIPTPSAAFAKPKATAACGGS